MRTRTVQLLLRNKILYLWGGVRAYRAGPDLDQIYMSSSRSQRIPGATVMLYQEGLRQVSPKKHFSSLSFQMFTGRAYKVLFQLSQVCCVSVSCLNKMWLHEICK